MTATSVTVTNPKVNQPDEWVFRAYETNRDPNVDYACVGYAFRAAIDLSGWGDPGIPTVNMWQKLTAGDLRGKGRFTRDFVPHAEQPGMNIRVVGESGWAYSPSMKLEKVKGMLEHGDAAIISTWTPHHAMAVVRNRDGQYIIHDNGAMEFGRGRQRYAPFEKWQGRNIKQVIVIKGKPEPEPQPEPEVKVNNRQRAWQLKAAAEGLCIKCGQPSTPARRSDSKTGLAKICKTCTDKDTARRRARKATAAA